jgi:hypothetical protein
MATRGGESSSHHATTTRDKYVQVDGTLPDMVESRQRTSCLNFRGRRGLLSSSYGGVWGRRGNAVVKTVVCCMVFGRGVGNRFDRGNSTSTGGSRATLTNY